MKNKHVKLAVSIGAAVSISACTAGQTGPPTQATVNPTQNGNGVLKIAVGTANIAGHAGLSLNVVALYRQSTGASAALVNIPRLTGPFGFPAPAGKPDSPSGQYDVNATADLGPSGVEVAGKYIGGSPQPTQIGAPSTTNTTFGVNGGVFGNGFAPANYGTSGLPASFTPYYQPFYAGVASGPGATTNNTFLPVGGPPAFDPAGNGHGATGPNYPQGGPSLGIDVFQGVIPNAGAYTLNVALPTSAGILNATPATATLGNAGLALPIATAGGAAPAVTFNGDGSLVVTNVALTAPTLGAYVQVVDYGATDVTAKGGAAGCNGATAGAPIFYTHWVTASGAVTFSNANASYGNTVAVCTAAQNAGLVSGDTLTGDNIQVVVVGFDYNEYSLQYNGLTGAAYGQSPALPAQADTSISLSTYVASP